ncbi:hypothetical protein ACEZCY_15510 [Streptacidiphilus sp. N1-12]|uniref:PLL-like beta propeller domain-containing protein n=2 Tax=Streptacidiphilus alkalitolerans TaxID=3342712 RepID=A0ABV6VBC0_9ACTN
MSMPKSIRNRKLLALSIAVVAATGIGLGTSTSSFAAGATASFGATASTAGSASASGPTRFTPTVSDPTTATAAELAAAAKSGGPGSKLAVQPQDSNAGDPITRAAIMTRAQNWVTAKVPYSESAYYTDSSGKYRTDCSGFISMAWDLPVSASNNWGYTTSTLPSVSTKLGSLDDLQPGDMIDGVAFGHVVLFKGWTNSSHTTAKVLEEPHSGETAKEDDSYYTRSYLTSNGFAPYRYNKIAASETAVHTFYHELRNTNGTWTGFKALAGAAGAATFAGNEEAIAAMPDGSAQVLGIGENGFLYHEVRNTDGTWTGFKPLDGLDGNPNFGGPDVAITGLPDGSSQVVGIGNNNDLYFRIRNADGTWTPFSLIPGNGGAASMGAKKVAVAGMPDGSSQVLAYGSDGKLYLDVRSAAGSWSGWSALDGYGDSAYFSGPDLSIAALPDGSSQILVIGLDGMVYHEVRSAAGVYSGFAPVTGVSTAKMGATAVAITGMPDGTAQVAVVGTDGNVWHRVRNTDGTWTAWGKPGTFAADQVGIAGFPDGTSQILATTAK